MKIISTVIIFLIFVSAANAADNATATLGISWNKGGQTIIDADRLNYDGEGKTYYLRGNVEIISKKDNSTISSDYAEFHEDSALALFKGNVIYEDNDVRAMADEAELYTDNNTGILRHCRLLFKKDNYIVRGDTIHKLSPDNYYVEKGSLTTCDAPVPAWCFYADETTIDLKDKIVSKNVTAKVNGTSVFYTPYFSQSLKRETGFLMPVVGYNSFKGTHISLPFYWAISENRDMTIVADYLSKRGEGLGAEYRYIEKGGIEGKWWIYGLRDRVADMNYVQIKGSHSQFDDSGFSLVADVNYLNEKDYYQLYSPSIQTSISRYIDSTAEAAYSTEKIRTYLLSQYWVDLQNPNGYISERVPELGFVVNPTSVGLLDAFSMRSSLANFISQHNVKGERFDIFPKLYYSAGDGIRFTQTGGARATLYRLSHTADGRDTINNVAGVYNASIDATYTRDYSSFTHIFQPSLRFRYISDDIYNDSDTYLPPIFDSTELFKKTAATELAFMNYFRNRSGTFLLLNLVNSYDALDTTYRLQPMKLQIALKTPFILKAEAAYDFKTGEVTEINSAIGIKVSDKINVSVGERYNQPNSITYISPTTDFIFSKEYSLRTSIWYDARAQEAKYYSADLFYKKQCWGLDIRITRTPTAFGVYVLLDLKGFGSQQMFSFMH